MRLVARGELGGVVRAAGLDAAVFLGTGDDGFRGVALGVVFLPEARGAFGGRGAGGGRRGAVVRAEGRGEGGATVGGTASSRAGNAPPWGQPAACAEAEKKRTPASARARTRGKDEPSARGVDAGIAGGGAAGIGEEARRGRRAARRAGSGAREECRARARREPKNICRRVREQRGGFWSVENRYA